MMHVGDIMSTVEVFSTVGGYSLLLSEYPTILNIPMALKISPTVLMISSTVLMISPTVLNTPKVLSTSHGTEHALYRVLFCRQ